MAQFGPLSYKNDLFYIFQPEQIFQVLLEMLTVLPEEVSVYHNIYNNKKTSAFTHLPRRTFPNPFATKFVV